MEAHIISDLWDLEDWGFDTALDELQNNVGITGLTVRIDPPPATQFRARAADAPRLYHNTGGLWFRTQADRYTQTRLKPIHAPEMRSRNPFARLADICADRDVALRAWVHGCCNPLAAAKHTDMAARNALDHTSARWLCPSHPDVAAYLHALLHDLSEAHALDAIILASPI